MKLKVKPSKTTIAKAGIFPAEVIGIEQDDKKEQWSIEFKLPNSATLKKDFPQEIQEEDLTHRDIKKIRNSTASSIWTSSRAPGPWSWWGISAQLGAE